MLHPPRLEWDLPPGTAGVGGSALACGSWKPDLQPGTKTRRSQCLGFGQDGAAAGFDPLSPGEQQMQERGSEQVSAAASWEAETRSRREPLIQGAERSFLRGLVLEGTSACQVDLGRKEGRQAS